ncbi:MAG: hypothetical protein ACLRZ9_09285 [Eubacterium sp.]
MTYDTYRYIFIGAAILCAVMLVVTVILFFALNIRKVFGDLTGKRAKKEIQKIREDNEKFEDKRYKSDSVNKNKEKITDEINQEAVQRKPDVNAGIITAKIATQNLGAETEVLAQEVSDETSILNENINETTVLSQNFLEAGIFEIESDITFIHTSEVIS